jgi:hypothetical protein
MDQQYETYPTKVFIDSNVVLECRPLKDLPWHEIDACGPILVMLNPTLLQEVDSKKRDGRLAVRAREFNRSVAPIAQTGRPISLRTEAPRVDMVLSTCSKINWDSYDDLDPNEGDAHLIAEVLNVQGVPFEQRIVVSQDINPLFMAKRHDLRTHHVSESWLNQPEQSPQEKEIAKLKRQVAEYAKSEPVFDIELHQPPDILEIFQVNPLPAEEVEKLIKKILKVNPKPVQTTHPFGMSHVLGGFDSTLDDRYEEYESVVVPKFAANIHKKLELQHGQFPLEITLKNTGNVRADHLCIEFKVIGGWFNSKPIVSRIPPLAPRIKDRLASIANIPPLFRKIQIGRHEIDINKPERVSNFSAQCEDFRQGQEWIYSGILWADPHEQGDMVIIVKVTAANFHGESSKIFKIKKDIAKKDVSDLIDPDSFAIVVQSHIDPLIKSVIEDKNFEGIEIDKSAE